MTVRATLFPCLAVISAMCPPALASANARVVYVDSMQVHGRVEQQEARAFLVRVLGGLGYTPKFAESIETGKTDCAGSLDCLRRRAESVDATMALRATFLELAGTVSILVVVLHVDEGKRVVHERTGIDLGAGDRSLAMALQRDFYIERHDSGPRTRTWVSIALAGGAVALAVAGGLSLGHADTIEKRFFTEHVDNQGRVHGISVRDATAQETRARTFTALGWGLVAAAGVAGVTATVVYLGDDGARGSRSVSVGIAGRF